MTLALVTNDDGIDSAGLHALAAAALEAGLDVVVAAPAEQASGASAALTAIRRDGHTIVESRQLPGLDVPAWAVQAQPGHIVAAALNGWFDPRPGLVLSGINHGANVGRAVLHSGTVGAALTAKISDTRALAVSLDVALHPTGERRHWETAAGLIAPVLELLFDAPDGTVLSLNVPDRPAAEVGPIRHARLARGGAVQTKVEEVRDGGVRLSEVEIPDAPDPDTDSALLDAGHATLTELRSVEAAEDGLVSSWLSAHAST